MVRKTDELVAIWLCGMSSIWCWETFASPLGRNESGSGGRKENELVCKQQKI